MGDFFIQKKIFFIALLIFSVFFSSIGVASHGESDRPSSARNRNGNTSTGGTSRPAESTAQSSPLYKQFLSVNDPLVARRMLRDASDTELNALKEQLKSQQNLSPLQEEALEALEAVLSTRELYPEDTLSPITDEETKEERIARSLLGERYYEQLGGDKKLSSLLGPNSSIEQLSTTQKLEKLLNPKSIERGPASDTSSVLSPIKNVRAIGPNGQRYPISQTDEGNWIKPIFDKTGKIDPERVAISTNGGQSYQVNKTPEGLSVDPKSGTVSRSIKPKPAPSFDPSPDPSQLAEKTPPLPKPSPTEKTPNDSAAPVAPDEKGMTPQTTLAALSARKDIPDTRGNLFLKAPSLEGSDNPELKQKLYDAGLGLLAEGYTIKLSPGDMEKAQKILDENGLSSSLENWVIPAKDGQNLFSQQLAQFSPSVQAEAKRVFTVSPTDGVKETQRHSIDEVPYQEGQPRARFSPRYSEDVDVMATVGFSNAHHDFENHYHKLKSSNGGKEPSITEVVAAVQKEFQDFENDFGGTSEQKTLFRLGMASYYKVPTDQLQSYLTAKILGQLPQAPFMKERMKEGMGAFFGSLVPGTNNPKK